MSARTPGPWRPLTEIENNAVRAYAQEHGRTWKQHLRDSWMNGGDHGPVLQNLRNSHGPTWLDTTSVKKPTPTASLSRDALTARGSRLYVAVPHGALDLADGK